MEHSSIATFNVRSLKDRQNVNTVAAIEQIFLDMHLQLIAIQEPYYTTPAQGVHFSFIGSRLCGFAICNKLKFEMSQPNNRICNIAVNIRNSKWMIINLYAPANTGKPPETYIEFWTEARKNALAIKDTYPNSPILIMGDLNCTFGESSVTNPNVEAATELCQELLLINVNNAFFQHTPTFEGFSDLFPPAALDWVLGNNAALRLISHCCVRAPSRFRSLFDHKIVKVNIIANTPHHHITKKPRQETQQSTKKRPKPPTTTISYMSASTLQLADVLIEAERDAAWCAPHMPNTLKRLRDELKQTLKEEKEVAWQQYGTALHDTLSDGGSKALFAALRPPRTKKIITLETKQQLHNHFANILSIQDQPLAPAIFPNAPTRPQTINFPQESDNEQIFYTDGSVRETMVGYGLLEPKTTIAIAARLPTSTSVDGAETAAILHAISLTTNAATIYTDSLACIETFEKIAKLARSNFDNVPNGHTWRCIFIQLHNKKITLHHVRAHQGNISTGSMLNEAVDKVAKFGSTLNEGTTLKALIPPAEFNELANSRRPSNIMQKWNWIRIPQQTTAYSELIPFSRPDKSPTEHEVRAAIMQLKNDTTPGPDKITKKMLLESESTQQLLEELTDAWETGHIPDSWKHSALIVLPKSQKPLGPDNCRGISLLNNSSKVLARIILNRHPIIPILPIQLAYTRARSTTHAIQLTQHTIASHRATNTELVLAFIDISKAFDGVRRDLIPTSLRQYGFPPRENMDFHPAKSN